MEKHDGSEQRQRKSHTTTQISAPRQAQHLTLLGGFSLIDANGESIDLPLNAQRLIAFLAFHREPVLRVFAAGSLWPETTQERALASLRFALWRVQKCGAQVILATRTTLSLIPDVTIDLHDTVATINRLINRGHPCIPGDLIIGRLTQELLPFWSTDEWVSLERAHVRQLRLRGLEAMSNRLLAVGRVQEAVAAALAAVQDEPLRESAQRALIVAYAAEGNQSDARRQYHNYQRLLLDELGVEPSGHMDRLATALNIRPRHAHSGRKATPGGGPPERAFSVQ
jgi:DNA-binding SARP family transcriptional activator